MDSDDKVFKIVIIGNPSVGKTSLRRTYLGENFQTNYLETIGSDFSFKNIIIGEEQIGLAIWDLAGQPKFESVRPLYYKGAVGAIVVFSIIDKNSYNDIIQWIHKFVSGTRNKDVPILLIGNKIDLIKEKSAKYITSQDQENLVTKIKEKYEELYSITSIRMSAKSGENVDLGITNFSQEVFNWVKENSKSLNKMQRIKNVDENFPSAYLLTMNQISGPKIIASSPSIHNSNANIDKISNSAIKLIASLDFEDIISHSTVTGTFPWIEPLGTVYYIAFVIENVAARGSKELYVIGLNTNRELEEAIAGLIGIVNGFLHGTLNNFNKIRNSNQIDFVTKPIKFEENIETIKDIEKILFELRSKVNKSVITWYNIT